MPVFYFTLLFRIIWFFGIIRANKRTPVQIGVSTNLNRTYWIQTSRINNCLLFLSVLCTYVLISIRIAIYCRLWQTFPAKNVMRLQPNVISIQKCEKIQGIYVWLEQCTHFFLFLDTIYARWTTRWIVVEIEINNRCKIIHCYLSRSPNVHFTHNKMIKHIVCTMLLLSTVFK